MPSPLQGFVRDERLPGIAGDLADTTHSDKLSITNDDPRAAQVENISVDAATNDKVYTVTINGVDITYTADATATTAEISAGLTAAINAAPLVNGTVSATDNGTDFDVTAKYAGTAFTIAENDTELTLTTTTANATASAVPFGRMVVDNGLSASNNKLGKLAASATMTAQVQELALTYDATVDALVGVKVYDPATGLVSTYKVEHTMATDADTSVIALAGLLNGVLPANTVVVSHPTADTLTFTAEIAGVGFELEYGFGTAADTGAWAHTIPTAGDDINKHATGVSLRDHTEEVALGGLEADYPGGSAMSVLRNGRMYVATEAALSSISDGVFVRLSASGSLDALGGFAPAAGTGLVKWEGARWVRKVSASLAVLEVNL